MVLHWIEPRHHADHELILCDSPCCPQRPSGRRVGPYRLGVDSIGNDGDAIGRQPAGYGVGARGARVGDNEIGTSRQKGLQSVTQRR
jgi:hypothetical protein